MLSPIHVLLGEEYQDWALPLITACMDAHSLLALRATCRDGRRAATAEYDPVEAHQFFNGRRPVIAKPPWQWSEDRIESNRSDLYRSIEELVKYGRLRAYQQVAFALRGVMSFEAVARAAVKCGQIPILNWMHNENGPSMLRQGLCEDFCSYAAWLGQLETLKWLRAQQPPFWWGTGIFDDATLGAIEPRGELRPQPDHRPYIAVLDYALAQKCPGHDYSPRHNVGTVFDSAVVLAGHRLLRMMEDFGKPGRLRRKDDEATIDAVAALMDWYRPKMPDDWNEKVDQVLAATRRALPPLPGPINARPPRWC
jgi:hypothetical protein